MSEIADFDETNLKTHQGKCESGIKLCDYNKEESTKSLCLSALNYELRYNKANKCLIFQAERKSILFFIQVQNLLGFFFPCVVMTDRLRAWCMQHPHLICTVRNGGHYILLYSSYL